MTAHWRMRRGGRLSRFHVKMSHHEESANPSPSALSSYAPLCPARDLFVQIWYDFDKIKTQLLVSSEQSR
jgi:hypothetical protein